MLKLSSTFIKQFNDAVAQSMPFVFLIDFEGKKPLIFSLDEAKEKGLWFKTPLYSNYAANNTGLNKKPDLQFKPVSFDTYRKAFETVQKHLQNGDTYLLNLTVATPIFTKSDLQMIFHRAQAPYKILYKDHFVCYTPETFVKITGDTIYTYPMKGTVDAALPNAHQRLLSNKKETYEHHTIVDLLRNDLAQIATDIQVTKFKYLDAIQTSRGKLLQMSSEITGTLPRDWRQDAAGLFLKLLPAGSICGAPKLKTLEIINAVEQQPRGYYTGIFGYFDGQNFDTAVLIRFIEKQGQQLFYRSGGGITALSRLQDEYQELKQKIYVPTR